MVLILDSLLLCIAVGHPIRMELNTSLTKLKTNTISLYLSIFNGKYLRTDLTQQCRLILKQTRISTFGVISAPLFREVSFSVFHESLDSTSLSSK